MRYFCRELSEAPPLEAGRTMLLLQLLFSLLFSSLIFVSFLFLKEHTEEMRPGLLEQIYAHLISLENKTCLFLFRHITICPLAQPPYARQEKENVSISIPIAYDSSSASVTSGAKRCLFEKSPRRARRLPASIFDAVAHFECLARSGGPAPPEARPHQPHYNRHLPPAALRVEQSKLIPRYRSTSRGAVVTCKEGGSSSLGCSGGTLHVEGGH